MSESETSEKEQNWMRGYRTALVSTMMDICGKLGFKDPAAEKVWWIEERQRAINILRDVCEDYGDNEWPDELYLADIIEKHLQRHLDAGSEDADDE